MATWVKFSSQSRTLAYCKKLLSLLSAASWEQFILSSRLISECLKGNENSDTDCWVFWPVLAFILYKNLYIQISTLLPPTAVPLACFAVLLFLKGDIILLLKYFYISVSLSIL